MTDPTQSRMVAQAGRIDNVAKAEPEEGGVVRVTLKKTCHVSRLLDGVNEAERVTVSSVVPGRVRLRP